jgi:hypothetical protein
MNLMTAKKGYLVLVWVRLVCEGFYGSSLQSALYKMPLACESVRNAIRTVDCTRTYAT